MHSSDCKGALPSTAQCLVLSEKSRVDLTELPDYTASMFGHETSSPDVVLLRVTV
jgi:hypothetical protein